ncbi:21798_t:CDS:1, partial [Gigaspora rosea]
NYAPQSMPKKTCSHISNIQKKEICEFTKKNPSYRHQEIENKFIKLYPNLQIDRSTVTKIPNKADIYNQIQKTVQAERTFRHHSVKYSRLELAINIWIEQVIIHEIIILDSLIREKGRQFAKEFDIPETSLAFSSGWVTKFKRRNGLKKIVLHCESASAPLKNLPVERKKLQELLSHYNPEDIYNADETGLFYRLLPNQTLSKKPMAGEKK